MKVLTTLLAVLALGVSVNAQAPKGEKGKGPKMTPEEAFKKKDGNGDGKVSKEEFTKTKDASKAEGLGKMFDAKDKNKDGSLDLEEFKAGGKPKGKGKKPE
jgi:Ca2+-binding EF-hand superfamily protein